MAYENVIDQKCFFCESKVSGNQKYMTNGKNLAGQMGRIPQWLKAKPEWRWAWNGLGDIISGEHIQFLFYLCPEHQTQEHYNQAFKWAQEQIDKRKMAGIGS